MPPKSSRLNGTPANPFSSRLRICDLKSAAIEAPPTNRRGIERVRPPRRGDLREGNERGDAGGEHDKQQTNDHLISGFGIVAFPVADNRPTGAHVHNPKPQKPDHSGNW